MEYLSYFLMAFFASSSIFIFFTKKGAFHTRHLYQDNFILMLVVLIISVVGYNQIFKLDSTIILIFLIPVTTFMLFMILLLYRFFRDPTRITKEDSDLFYAPADGQIIYIKELEKDQIPVSLKKHRMSKIEEITKTDILSEPCYLVGITMTLFDVHVNRSPIAGKVILSQHTPGTYLGLKHPESTFTNERNTIVIENSAKKLKVGVVQIASRFVKRCISTVSEGQEMKQGEQIGLIRWGSQADLIIPRNCDILVRNGDQVFAGITPIAKLRDL